MNSLYTSFWLHGLTSFIKNAIVKQPLLKTRMVIGPQTGCSDHRLALVQLGQFCSGLDPLCVNQIVFWMLFKVIMDLWFSSQAQKARFFGPKSSVKRGAMMLSFRLQFYQNQKDSQRQNIYSGASALLYVNRANQNLIRPNHKFMEINEWIVALIND